MYRISLQTWIICQLVAFRENTDAIISANLWHYKYFVFKFLATIKVYAYFLRQHEGKHTLHKVANVGLCTNLLFLSLICKVINQLNVTWLNIIKLKQNNVNFLKYEKFTTYFQITNLLHCFINVLPLLYQISIVF